MYLSRIVIKDFRSIRELNLKFSPGKNVIVGRNNSGKSNIIKAIDLVLGENSPAFAKSENVTEIDFYTRKEIDSSGKENIVSSREIYIFCELKRDKDEKLDYEEMYKCNGFKVSAEIIRWEQDAKGKSKPVKRPKRIKDSELQKVFEVPDDSEFIYVDHKLRHQKTFESQFEDKNCFGFVFRANKDEDGNVTKCLRFVYREDESHDWVMAFYATIRNELLQSAIIPSFRDPANQLRLSNWTWYGKLMRFLTDKPAKSKELMDAFKQVKDVGDQIFQEAKDKVQTGALEISFPGTEIHFQFNTDLKTDIYKNCVIYVDDGFKSQLVDKGSGIQSATIIGLFNYYVKNIATKTSALLCIEEPELYLHPHARRVISDKLDAFLENNKNQVIITTHSSEFIRTTKEDMNIIFVKKEKSGCTIALPIEIKNYKRLLLDNNQNELFFADKVVVCEGFDNYILRWIAQEKFTGKLDEENVSIISVGGKDKIDDLTKMVLNMGIECYVFADFDYFLRDQGVEADKYDPKNKHESIQTLGAEFFKQTCIYGSVGDTKFSELQKLRAQIKQHEEKKFYTAKKLDDFKNGDQQKLKILSDFLADLRAHGICTLTQEIEGFCRDDKLLAPDKKLTLDSIFDINAQIDRGAKISDLFDINEPEEFLKTVFRKA